MKIIKILKNHSKIAPICKDTSKFCKDLNRTIETFMTCKKDLPLMKDNVLIQLYLLQNEIKYVTIY